MLNTRTLNEEDRRMFLLKRREKALRLFWVKQRQDEFMENWSSVPLHNSKKRKKKYIVRAERPTRTMKIHVE